MTRHEHRWLDDKQKPRKTKPTSLSVFGAEWTIELHCIDLKRKSALQIFELGEFSLLSLIFMDIQSILGWNWSDISARLIKSAATLAKFYSQRGPLYIVNCSLGSCFQTEQLSVGQFPGRFLLKLLDFIVNWDFTLTLQYLGFWDQPNWANCPITWPLSTKPNAIGICQSFCHFEDFRSWGPS